MSRQLSRESYTIGCICALPLELTAVVAMLEARHLPPPQEDFDDNAYEFGRIGSYNIVIACLPSGVYGVTSAAIVATQMRRSFPDLVAGLMVGIAGGAPVPSVPQRDIRLGDVVVSEPTVGFGGVLQYDFGKTVEEGRFVQTGVLNKPPKILLAALSKLKSDYTLQQGSQPRANPQISEIIAQSLESGTLPQQYARPPNDSDRLFQAYYDHPSDNKSCDQCDSFMVVERTPRPHDEPYIHYGLIASGNQVMKHGITRDRLAQEKNVLCFEMEAAGIMDELPSLVIRGICDYSDSHKNKAWQSYSALAAAAFAKELLLRLPLRGKTTDGKEKPERIDLGLPVAEGATYGSYADQHKPECLLGTRVDLLNLITSWTEDPNGKSIFWLAGRAGTGKSTISRTVAHNLRRNNQLAASFFFNKEEGDRRTGARFFTTIATELAKHYPGIAPKIQAAIRDDPDIATKALGEQFEKLIFQPLLSTRPASDRTRLVLVIDALDECEDKGSIKVIIYLLSRLKDIKPVDVRVFLTSRPDLPILPAFRKLPGDIYQDIALHDVPKVEDDISLFLQHKLNEIREGFSLPETWPGKKTFQKLVERAVPLFIYAATLCRYIGDEQWDPEERVQTILSYRADWQTSQIHMTYLPVLNQLIVGQPPAQKQKLIEEFQQIVGTIINIASPMSASSLASLLSLPIETVNCRIRPLQSILNIPQNPNKPIRTFHLSFRDFLLDPSIQEENPFWVDECESHGLIAIRCIELMSGSAGPGTGLRRNICNLPSHGTLKKDVNRRMIKKCIPPELQYACRYWAYHVVRSGYRLIDGGKTHKFLFKHLLHWLEAGSLINIRSEVLQAVEDLNSSLNTENSTNVSALIHDIKRFVIQNQDIICRAPLQVYASALIFAPKRSIVRTIFDPKQMAPYVKHLPDIRDEWGPVLQVLEEPKGVSSFAFSPHDANVLASGSGAGTIMLWDATTGSLLQTIESHGDTDTDSVVSVAFSPSDDNILASASSGERVKIWDITTGELLRVLSHGRLGRCGHLKIAFSPDGKVLALALSNKIVLWDPMTGILLRKLKAPQSPYIGLMFSPSNGNVLASASGRGTGLWDITTGVLLRMLGEDDYNARDIAFSPDGQVLTSVHFDKVVWWDAATGLRLHIREEYGSAVPGCAAFSPDGKVLALALTSRERTRADIEIWNTTDPRKRYGGDIRLLRTLKGYQGGVEKIVFSPDSKTFASVPPFSSNTITLWDATYREGSGAESLRALEWRYDTSSVLSFSPNGKLVVSGSFNRTFKLWDFTGMLSRILQGGYARWFNDVAFSPNGKFLASATGDKTIKLWDSTGTLLQVLGGNHRQVVRVRFSPDGKVLASRSKYGAIELWDLKGTLLQTLEEDEHQYSSFAFSPNGKFLAAITNKEIKLWDLTETPARVFSQKSRANASWMQNIVVLSDNKTLATILQVDGSIELWCSEGPSRELDNDWIDDFILSPNNEKVLPLDTDAHSLYQAILSLKKFKGAYQREADPYKTILVVGEWLVRNGQRLIWLPPDYRPLCLAVDGNKIVLGSHSGILCFAFATSLSSYAACRDPGSEANSV
ncbi:hypothetical protein TWF718_002012 [Orbilia javanica]|uniref:NACHT domain-containing protein n=1 Tax=Orbilia javanica TaxID=47235 RepID=A0AAN8RNV2_9PEZI